MMKTPLLLHSIHLYKEC